MKASLKSFAAAVLFAVCSCISASGQDAHLRINNLDALEAKASQTIEVTVDQQVLQLAEKFLRPHKPTEAKVKEVIRGLKGIYVRSYKFQNEAEYSPADFNSVRMQLNAPGWSRMVNVRSKIDGLNVEVFTMLDAGKINGLAVIAAQPKRLTVVNVVGPIDLNKLSELEGQFGIPQLGLEQTPISQLYSSPDTKPPLDLRQTPAADRQTEANASAAPPGHAARERRRVQPPAPKIEGTPALKPKQE